MVGKIIKRNTLKSLKLVEGASSKADEHFERFEEIKEICLQYNPENIHNMDEAALLFRQTPRFTYCFDSKQSP